MVVVRILYWLKRGIHVCQQQNMNFYLFIRNEACVISYFFKYISERHFLDKIKSTNTYKNTIFYGNQVVCLLVKAPDFVQLVKQVIIIETQTPFCVENGLLLMPVKD